ncbi:MAG: hypothetical protein CMP48_11265 [Rickettsiales bacterium]|nr:hypothetical protein [Rickettsiales bacterium]
MVADLLDSIYVDQVKPTIEIIYDSYVNNDTFNVEFMASEAVVGMSPEALYISGNYADLTVVNIDTISNSDYMVTFRIPEEEFHELYLCQIGVYTDKVWDLVGNRIESAGIKTIRVDRYKPKLTFQIDQKLSNKPNTNVALNFSETPIDFDIEDLNVENGTISEFTGADINYSLVLTAEAEGNVRLYVKDSAFYDKANHYNNSSETIYQYDNTGLEVEIRTLHYTNESLVDSVYLIFQEPVNLYKQEDIKIENGTLQQVWTISDSVYQIYLFPEEEGVIKVSVSDSAFLDLAGNPIISSKEDSFVYDITPPTAYIEETEIMTNQSPIPIRIEFNEQVNVLDSSAIQFETSNYNVQDFKVFDSAISFSVSISNDDISNMTFDRSKITDLAGNRITYWSATISYDNTPPEDFTLKFFEDEYLWTPTRTVGFIMDNAEYNAIYSLRLSTSDLSEILMEDTVFLTTMYFEDIAVGDLQPGTLTLEMTLTDQFGNQTTKSTESELRIVTRSELSNNYSISTDGLKMNIAFKNSEYATSPIRILDMSGKTVFSDSDGIWRENLSISLPVSGVYVVQIATAQQIEVVKVRIVE